MLTIETPMGILRATRSNYANHPGIWIELQRQGEKEFDPLVLVEYTDDEEGLPDNTEAIITKDLLKNKLTYFSFQNMQNRVFVE